MSNKFFVQINTELPYDELLLQLESIGKNNSMTFSNLNNSAEWLLCDNIIDTYIDKNVNDSEMKDLFISHSDGLSARLYSSDLVQYERVEGIIKDYEKNDMNDELLND